VGGGCEGFSRGVCGFEVAFAMGGGGLGTH